MSNTTLSTSSPIKSSVLSQKSSSFLSLEEKLAILTDAAKYDVACTSSGVARNNTSSSLGNTIAAGICHSYSADGRCISLLKILLTNECIYDCVYCCNNRNMDQKRATFTPEEVASLTIEFYRRNYIEGLFLSSGVHKSPNHTMEQIYQSLHLLRHHYHFEGYIHVKAIPGADPALIEKVGFLADRMSINLELPTSDSLKSLAPCKSRTSILTPMRQIQQTILTNKQEIIPYQKNPVFVPAGQSTQMIIGATPETDYQIVSVAEKLYQNFQLKRVFYSAFINVTANSNLPMSLMGPPLLREHRLYQADWLLRFYKFTSEELLSTDRPNFNIFLDPKCDWALRNLSFFPVEIQTASKDTLLRVPGIGPTSVLRIIKARSKSRLTFSDLKKFGVVLKRALYFVTCSGKMMYKTKLEEDYITRNLLSDKTMIPKEIREGGYEQLSLFDSEHAFPSLLVNNTNLQLTN